MESDEFVSVLDEAFSRKGMVVFTGAGLSTASGIKDFRGKNGLYKENVNAEEILSHHFFVSNPEEFYRFYRDNLINEDVKPNLMHKLISSMQKEGIVSGIITQNIDGLDKMAGSKDVIELHGNASRFYCTKCKKKYSLEDIKSMDLVPRCECGGIVRPDIVLYEEPLDMSAIWTSQEKINFARNLLVIGTSLKVNPAAALVHDFVVEKRFDKNKKLALELENKIREKHGLPTLK